LWWCFFFQFYCLPDNYEVIDSSLDDIKVNNFVNITFTYNCRLFLILTLKSCFLGDLYHWHYYKANTDSLRFSNCLNWKIYCDDHSSLSSTTTVHIWIISYKLHINTDSIIYSWFALKPLIFALKLREDKAHEICVNLFDEDCLIV